MTTEGPTDMTPDTQGNTDTMTNTYKDDADKIAAIVDKCLELDRVAVTVYGTSADPMVRTTLAAADGKIRS